MRRVAIEIGRASRYHKRMRCQSQESDRVGICIDRIIKLNLYRNIYILVKKYGLMF